jgi:hypothetical protein
MLQFPSLLVSDLSVHCFETSVSDIISFMGLKTVLNQTMKHNFLKSSFSKSHHYIPMLFAHMKLWHSKLFRIRTKNALLIGCFWQVIANYLFCIVPNFLLMS